MFSARAHLDIRPRVAQDHLARLLVHVSERIVDMREEIGRDVLRRVLAPVDPPVTSAF